MIGFPSDVMPSKKADIDQWAKDFVNAIITKGQGCYNSKDRENFAYAQGRVPESDFDYITKLYVNPNTPDRVLPSRIRQVNTIAHIINRILGKYATEELDYTASIVNQEGYEEKIDEITKIGTEKLARLVRQKNGINDILGQPIDVMDLINPEDLESIKAMDFKKYKTEAEINVSRALHWLLTDVTKGLQYKLTNQLLYNYLVTGKMAIDVYKGIEDPELDIIHPEHLLYDLSSMSPMIHKGRYAGYYYSATPQELIDKCPELTKEDIEYIESLMEKFAKPESRKQMVDEDWNDMCGWYVENDTLYIECYRIYFKALKWVRAKVTPNKLDEDNPHIHFVDDEHVDKSNGKYEQRVTDTLWECTRIGANIFYQLREMKNQVVDEDAPSNRELPIKGIVDFNPCIVDLLKPFESMKINAFYSIDRLIGQAKGKILIIDEAIEDDPTENNYTMMTYGVYRVNSAKEGQMQLHGGQPIQPKEVDMGLSKAVEDLMRFVEFLDSTMILVSGVNEGYMGIINSNTGLGTQQNAIQQAQMSIYPYISTWYTVIQTALQEMCSLLPMCWKGKDKVKYYIGERGETFFNLKTDSGWDLHKYGLIVQNKLKSKGQKDTIIGMAQQLLPTTNDPNFAMSLIKMVNSTSAAEAEEILQKGINAINKIKKETEKVQQEQMVAQNQMAQQQAQATMQLEQQRLNVPIEVERIRGENEMNILEQKLRHKEDEMDVIYKQGIKNKIADSEIQKNNIEEIPTSE